MNCADTGIHSRGAADAQPRAAGVVARDAGGAGAGGCDAMAHRHGGPERGWREHDGDNPAWAQPNFDDSGWKTVELDDLGAATLGTRWYRLQVQLAPNHPHLHVLIAGGEGTYEMYVNGQQVQGTEMRPLFGVTRPTERVYSVRDEDTELTIALRTSANPTYTGWYLPLFLTATLGSPGSIDNERRAMESQRLYAALPSIAINLLVMLAGIAAFALYRSQRKHAEYLWLGLYLFLLGLSNLLLYCSISGMISLAWNNLLADPLIYVFTIMQIQFTFSFAGQRVTRVWRMYEWALLTPIILAVLVTAGWFSSSRYVLVEAVAILPAALLLPVLLFVWYRRGNREAGWLIVPSLLPAATTAVVRRWIGFDLSGVGAGGFSGESDSGGAGSAADLRPGGFAVCAGDWGGDVFPVYAGEPRAGAGSGGAACGAGDSAAAGGPERLPEIEGYEVEAAYFPAEEVGGDFYQVLDTMGGAKLVVVGDVSGKGLKAAMTGRWRWGRCGRWRRRALGPGALLMRLNRQLVETSDEGFVTCVCARVTAKGDVTLANAGHLPPYRNGEEIAAGAGFAAGDCGRGESTPEHCVQAGAGGPADAALRWSGGGEGCAGGAVWI